MYSLKDKSGRTMMDHAKTKTEAVHTWEYFGCGRIPGKEPVYSFKGNWSSIIDDMIFYHLSINYVAFKFHPIKIMISHWQRINETHQCTRTEVFDWPAAWVTVWWLPQSRKWWNCAVVWAAVWRTMCHACSDSVSADKFLLWFLSDDESLSVTWSPRIAKKSLLVQVLHK